MFFNAFRITSVLHVGTYPDEHGQAILLRNGITHILNVGPRGESQPEGFAWRWVPIDDLRRIPDEVAIRAIEALHEMVTTPDSRVFVHCLAGQNRSPNTIWLYLVASGVPRDEAAEWIANASFDAVPAHPALVDDDLVQLVREHGSRRGFCDRIRPDAFAPVDSAFRLE